MGGEAVGGGIDDGNPGMVCHAAEVDGTALLESPGEGIAAIVPFAGGEGAISMGTEVFGQHESAAEVIAEAEPGTAAHEHGATGDADGAAVGAETVIGAEAHAASDEIVEVRGADVMIPPGGEGVGALIVGEKDEEVGALGCGAEGKGGEQSEEQTHQQPAEKLEVTHGCRMGRDGAEEEPGTWASPGFSQERTCQWRVCPVPWRDRRVRGVDEAETFWGSAGSNCHETIDTPVPGTGRCLDGPSSGRSFCPEAISQ